MYLVITDITYFNEVAAIGIRNHNFHTTHRELVVSLYAIVKELNIEHDCRTLTLSTCIWETGYSLHLFTILTNITGFLSFLSGIPAPYLQVGHSPPLHKNNN
jgi:hypothetical protein